MRLPELGFLVLLLAANLAVAETNPIARQKGIDAFFRLDREWDVRAIQTARDEIEVGERMDAQEPWLMIARARYYLVANYKSGQNYGSEAVDAAFELSERAAKKAPNDAGIQTFYANQLYKKVKTKKRGRYYKMP